MKLHMRINLELIADQISVAHKVNAFPIALQAELLLESYRGTTDWEEGATQEDAIAEIEGTINGVNGKFVGEASGILQDELNKPISAIYCSIFDGEPFVVYVFTHPQYLGKGLASKLLAFSSDAFLRMGYSTLHLYVSDKNPAVQLYKKLGFTVVEN